MSVKLSINHTPIELKIWKFPAGEVGVRVVDPSLIRSGIHYITMDYESNDDLFVVAQVVDILKPWRKSSELTLACKYMPYARQDRKMTYGEANAMKVVAKFINTLGFDHVDILDPHSDVVEATIDNLFIMEQHEALLEFFDYITTDMVLVSPDAGALKKIYKAAKVLNAPVVCATKQRDVSTGQITSTKVDCEHIGDKDFLIVDDIGDGLTTFIELAKVLKPLTDGKIYLYITHGIFSKGYTEAEKHFEKIFVANMMNKETHPMIVTL